MAIWCKEGHYNNPQVIHKRPVHQLISCEIKSYVVNKQTNQDVFYCVGLKQGSSNISLDDQSTAPTLIKLTYLWYSNDLEDTD